MSKPHKYADVIKAWADGKAVQWAFPPTKSLTDPLGQDTVWREWEPPNMVTPTFDERYLWRIKPEPLEWQAEREAFARGERVQYRSTIMGGDWQDLAPGHGVAWDLPFAEYRIAPKKWAKEREAYARGERVQWRSNMEPPNGSGWLDIPRGDHFELNINLAFNEPTNEFRIPHKWQNEMDAQERGEKVQFRVAGGGWVDGYWSFDAQEGEYRIKPKTETHKIRVALMQHTSSSAPFIRTVITYSDATTVERQAAFVRWLCDWQEVEVEASPKLEQGGVSDGGVAAVKQALEDCAKFGAGAYQVGFDLGKPGGDHSCLFFRRVHINK